MGNFQKLRIIRIGCLQSRNGNSGEMMLVFQDSKKCLNNRRLDTKFGPEKYPAVFINDPVIPNKPKPSGQQGIDDPSRGGVRGEKP